MKIGYIRRTVDVNGKETFKYHEANGVRRIGARTDNVRVKFLMFPTPYKEVEDNTELMQGEGLILVEEPFLTDDKLKAKCEKWCEWASSCERKEYSLLK